MNEQQPAVILDADGDLWIDLHSTGEYSYLSPYAALGPVKSLDDLAEDNDGRLFAAEWMEA